jgi:hypothetical protein
MLLSNKLYHTPRPSGITVQQLILLLKDESVFELDIYFFRIRKCKIILRSHILDVLLGHHLNYISSCKQILICRYLSYAFPGMLVPHLA